MTAHETVAPHLVRLARQIVSEFDQLAAEGAGKPRGYRVGSSSTDAFARAVLAQAAEIERLRAGLVECLDAWKLEGDVDMQEMLPRLRKLAAGQL